MKAVAAAHEVEGYELKGCVMQRPLWSVFCRFRTYLGFVLAIIAAVGLASCSTPRTAKSGTASKSASSPPRSISNHGTTTWLGPDGVKSSALIAENRLTGTSAWRITNQGTGFIEGFADYNYAQQGDKVGLYVSTDQRSFDVIAYRMGWYGGSGARQIWRSARITGDDQPACPLQPFNQHGVVRQLVAVTDDDRDFCNSCPVTTY